MLHSGRLLALSANTKTRLERLAKDKHSRLLRKSVNYGHNEFYDTVANVIRLFTAIITSLSA
jgi:hypothetical protein